MQTKTVKFKNIQERFFTPKDREPATFKYIQTDKDEYNGIALRTYALGFKKTGKRKETKRFRELLHRSLHKTLDSFWQLGQLNKEKQRFDSYYDFDTLVVKEVIYEFIGHEKEAILAKMLFLKDGKAISNKELE